MEERIGPYEIEAVLQKTANSKVYVVFYEGKKAVLKIPSKWDFGKEVALLQSVNHPNIVPILKVERKLRGYVMPFVSNLTLRDHFNGGHVPWHQFQKIGLAIVSALAELHRNGIIYSDLAPQNILIIDEQPVLIDFGLAHRVSDIMPIQSRGTSGFIPPEVVEGSKWSFSGDVYSLGSLLKKMMKPYWEKDTSQTKKWKEVIERCLLEEPAERPMMASDVELLLTDQETEDIIVPEESEKYPMWVYVIGVFCLLGGILGGLYLSAK